jgi:hypothetical protein
MMGCTDEEPRKAAGLTGPGEGRPADPSPRGRLGAWSPAGGERECLHEEYSGLTPMTSTAGSPRFRQGFVKVVTIMAAHARSHASKEMWWLPVVMTT